MTDPFFVRIDDVNSIKISVLESSKIILMNLQIEQKIERIRERKLNKINELKTQIRELTFLATKLEELLPYKDLFKNEVAQIKKQVKGKVETKGKTNKKPVVVQKEIAKPKIVTDSKNIDKISQALNNHL